jgi:hypothetical protein
MAGRGWLEQGLRPSVAARQRTAKRRSEYLCRIDASALAAVLCALLFAFLATTPQPHNRGGLDLAKSQHFRRLRGALRDALRAMVTRHGRFYLAINESPLKSCQIAYELESVVVGKTGFISWPMPVSDTSM